MEKVIESYKILQTFWCREGRDSAALADLQSGHLEQVTQEGVQVDFKCLWRGRPHNLPEQPIAVLCHPRGREVLPHAEVKLFVFEFVVVAPHLVTGHHWKQSGTLLLTGSFRVFVCIGEIPSQFYSFVD